MANRIVHNHEGRIEPHNLDGGGAEFAVHLPLVGIWTDGELVKGNAALEAIASDSVSEVIEASAGISGPSE